MKIFAIIILVVCVEQTLQQSLEELKKLVEYSIVDCYEDEEKSKKVEITDSGFEDIANGSRDAVRNAKCIRYCIMKKHNLFSDDHTLNKSELLPFLAYIFNNSAGNDRLKRIVAQCNEAIARESDRCERSYVANNCILQHLNDGGLQDN